MDLSIIVVNWNTRELLGRCLNSVYETAGELLCEVFVVDNGSTDASTEMVRARFPQARLIENGENLGFARANNQAIRLAEGRYVLLLNSDAEVCPGALASMVEFADRHAAIGVLGPALCSPDGVVQPSWARFPTVWTELWGVHRRGQEPFAGHVPGEPAQAYLVDWMAGACLMVRQETFDQVGPMDERFFLYSEETDLCKRIRDAGWLNVYYPQAKVVHHQGASSSRDRGRSYVQLRRSKVLYAQKHAGAWSAACLRVGFTLLAVLKALFHSALRHRPQARANWLLAQRLGEKTGRPCST